jgi:hypothetical protein
VADAGGQRVNWVEVVGNIMQIGGADNNHGLSFLDLSDPLKPSIKATIDPATANMTYTYRLAGRRSNASGTPTYDTNTLYMYMAAGSATGVRIYKVSNDLRTLTSVYNTASLINSKIGYMTYQDGFIFGGWSSSGNKVNVAAVDANNPSVSVAKTGVSTQSGVDEDFNTVLGNVMFVGNDHDSDKGHGEHNGSAIYAHQANPDTMPPAVTYISPNNNATGLSTKVRVGVIFSDNVDIRTINTTTFTVKNHGTGAVLTGRYTNEFGKANFEPTTAFAAGTQYDVVINGIKDWAGNAMTTAFNSTFHHRRLGLHAAGELQRRHGRHQEQQHQRHPHRHRLHRHPTPTCQFDFGDGFVSAAA